MRVLLSVALCLLLSGCWFVFIPGSVIQAVGDGITGSFGNYCVGAGAVEGSKVRTPGGGSATVNKISGPSIRCPETTPIRAMVAFD